MTKKPQRSGGGGNDSAAPRAVDLSGVAPLVGALRDLIAWFEVSSVAGVIIGGVAASILGKPRFTHDVDALIVTDDAQWPELVASAERAGFEARIPDVLAFARRTRVLLLRHRLSGIDLDVSCGALPFERETVTRAKAIDVAGLPLPLPRVEDLIILKAIAHRPRDLADIEGLRESTPRLNLVRIRRIVSEFAALLEMPEIVEDMERALGSRGRRRPKDRLGHLSR